MDRLEAMSTFLAVVETGSLSAAARRLNSPLATVSRKVSDLESHLRTKLFNRSSRKLVLTVETSSNHARVAHPVCRERASVTRHQGVYSTFRANPTTGRWQRTPSLTRYGHSR